MTKIKFLLSLVIISTLFSCSDTKVIENLPDDTETAAPVPGYFKKRVLIEDYTGTWCGNCTRVAYAIDQMFEQSDKVVSIAIHNGNDPYHFANYQPLKDMILPAGNDLELPQSRLNRTIVWSSPEPSNLAQAKALTGNNAGLGLALSSTVAQDGTIDLDVNMKFAQNYTGLKLVVYVLEDGLLHNQANYTSYFGNVNPVHNYVHNHVLRQNITDLLGDPITEATTAGQTITKSFHFPVPAGVNPDNVNFVAILVNSDNLALNARHADKNEVQEFEQNP